MTSIMTFAVTLAVTFALVTPPVAAWWQNKFDKPHDITCSNGQVVNRIKSYHKNSYEDRSWDVRCGSLAGGLKADYACKQTDFVNRLDQPCTSCALPARS